MYVYRFCANDSFNFWVSLIALIKSMDAVHVHKHVLVQMNKISVCVCMIEIMRFHWIAFAGVLLIIGVFMGSDVRHVFVKNINDSRILSMDAPHENIVSHSCYYMYVSQ